MTKRMALSLLLMLAGVTVLVIRCTQEPGGPRGRVEIGQHAPVFQLKDLNGRTVSLDQFKGQVVMLDFWATWCGPCRITMPLLEKLHQEHPNNFTLLAVNVGDAPEEVAPFVQRQNIQARVLLDLDGKIGTAYQATSIPMQVLIDKEGIIRHIQVGYYAAMKEDLWAEIAKLQ